MKIIFIKNFPSFGLGLILISANAWASSTNVGAPSFACVGKDGIVFSDTTMIAKCCTNDVLNANAPDTCNGGGVNDDGSDSTLESFNWNTVAQNLLHQAQGMGTLATDINATPTPGSSGAEKSADTAGGSSGTSNLAGTGTSASLGNAGAGSGGLSASGSGGGGSGSGMGGLSDSSDGTSGKKAGATGDAPGTGGADLKDTRMAYLHNPGAADGASKGGNDKVGIDVGDDLKFGNSGPGNGLDANGNPLGANGAGGDEDGPAGVSQDKADYLKRIDRSANIFKVVTTAYMRKKSLWRVKEEESKLKKQ